MNNEAGIILDPDGNMAWLDGLSGQGIKFGLDNMRELLNRLGNPHEGLRTIHVAGSDGKGSVCAMIESMLNASGFRAAAFTSPHVLEFNECIRIEGEAVSDRDLVFILSKIRPIADSMAAEGMQCTQFEILTAVAFEYFAMVEADIAVIEVGMGGRLDCTNVIVPDVSVINNVGMEHTGFLGDTLEEIAYQKAGIMKPGVPCVTINSDEVCGYLERFAEEIGCPLKRVDPDDIEVISNEVDSVEMLYKGELYRVGLPGRMQARNAAVAIEAVSCLPEFPDTIEPNVSEGLSWVSWPCRMQKLMGEPIIIDVTHTLDGAICLSKDIEEIYGRVVLVLGMLSDKNISGVSEVLARLSTKVFIAPPASPRAASPEDMLETMRRYHDDVTLCPTVGDALRAALDARGEENVLVTGSFRTAEDALRWIQNGYARS
ncbi:MAG: bifunctional folylpolyglutamate synthase/dihydrofolate synthase [Candidatus Methanomethylophilaceae archaeon]|nr:bifunctional folylpolyglutamate synthase/dihydrofolate synthase [Candidatus Methanomethylophilaceae archaeon]